MANVDNPNGLTPVYMLGGGAIPMRAYNAGVTTAIFAGDLVKMGTGGRVIAETTTTLAADCVGVAANYIAAGTTPVDTVWVYDNPWTVFEVQSDGATDTDHKAFIGNAGPAILTTGNTTTGRSKHEIDYASSAGFQTTTASETGGLSVVGYYKHPSNDETLAHARMLVIIARHLYRITGTAE